MHPLCSAELHAKKLVSIWPDISSMKESMTFIERKINKTSLSFRSRIIYLSLRLYPDTSRLSRYIKPLAEQMSSQKELRELKDLIGMKQKAFEKATQGVKQALETVEINNQWKINMYMDLQRRLNRMLLRNFDYDFEDMEQDEEEKPQPKTI